jgi:hypothetical protein
MLQAFIGIYNEYKNLKHYDPQTLADIMVWMKDQTQKLLQKSYMAFKMDGQMVVEVGVRCGNIYLIKK